MKPAIHKNELRIIAALLFLILGGSAYFLAHSVLYTEGEVMQALYWFLLGLNVPFLLLALWKPRPGIWGILILGGLLLPWQAHENRQWAQIHEEIFGVIRYVDAEKISTGTYPADLGSYTFKRKWVEPHVMDYRVDEETYRLTYFMDHTGISYWYHSETGFGYYPD
jgi:hypothetical protein